MAADLTKTASLEAVGTLTDFLRGGSGESVRLEVNFELTPSVKDLIESRGIPHTAVFRIEVNGQAVPESHNITDGDSIAAYPVESLPPDDVDQIFIEPEAFILDVHLGKLAKTLRLMGLDASMNTGWNDEQIIRRSNEENRMILSRDIGLLKNGATKFGYWVRATDPERQAEEIFERFRLASHINPFSRCMECNGSLQETPLEKVSDRVPPKVREWHSQYWQCERCEKVYWKGSHFEKLRHKVEQLSGNLP